MRLLVILCAALGASDALMAPSYSLRARRGAALSIRMAEEEGSVKVRGVALEMSDMELAEQSAKMDALAAKWRKRQQAAEYEAASRVGWVEASEAINGRFAMFFLIVGLITEYYTGESVPQQVYTLFQTLGFVD